MVRSLSNKLSLEISLLLLEKNNDFDIFEVDQSRERVKSNGLPFDQNALFQQ